MKIQVRVPHAPPIAVQPAMELREWRVLEDVDAELLLIGLHVDSRVVVGLWSAHLGDAVGACLSDCVATGGVSDTGAD